MSDVTTVLRNMGEGKDPGASEQLLELVYAELRRIAQSKMSNERPGHTLQPTILVNDAWLKLFGESRNPQFKSRAYFFGTAARVMHRILVDHARRRNAIKRGEKVEMSETQFDAIEHPATDETTLRIHEALEQFAAIDESAVTLIEMRFYIGMTMREAAEALEMPERSAERRCAGFMAWFRGKYQNELKF